MPDEGVFAIPVGDRWLAYAPLHGVGALVNDAALRKLGAGTAVEGPLGELAGRLSSEAPAPPRRSGGVNPIFLGLIPSRLCNLHCVYCNFGVGGSAPKDRMDPALAVAAIDWIGQTVVENHGNTLGIHFFGGEPFVEWDLVEIAVHRARYVAAKHGLRLHLEASSNGVYSEEKARFIGDYFQGMVLSFDGFAETHDRHRPHADGRGSFAEVARTARIFAESPIELCLRICVTAENVDDLPEVVRWFSREFRPAYIDFETITATELGEKAGLTEPDPYQFARKFKESQRIATELGVIANFSADLQAKARRTFCPVGQDAMILTPDGRMSTCYLLEPDWQERGLDLVLGRIAPGQAPQLNQQAIQQARDFPLPGRCQRCFAQWSCAGGCRVNHSFPGCQDTFDDFCLQTRLIVAASVLEEMGERDIAEALLADAEASRRLAGQPSDLLRDVVRAEVRV